MVGLGVLFETHARLDFFSQGCYFTISAVQGSPYNLSVDFGCLSDKVDCSAAAGHWTEAPVWRAGWIAAHPADVDANEPMPLFRRTFTLSRPVARAVLYASGVGQDELRLNGRKVGNDELTPGWSDYRKTVYYDEMPKIFFNKECGGE